MNLGQIRDRIERALTYSPGVKAHREHIKDRVNDALREFVMSQRWTFRERWAELQCPSDRTFADTVSTVAAGSITFTDGCDPDEFHFLQAWSAGVIDASAHYPNDPSTGGPGQVVGYHAVERAVESSGDLVVYPDPGWPGAPLTADENVVLRVYRYALPWDVSDILDIMDRDGDRGSLRYISSAREGRLMFNSDEVGTPHSYLLDPVARYNTIQLDGARNASTFRRWGYTQIPAPWTPDVVLTDEGAGSLPAGTYEYCYTWEYAGLESGPSEVLSITVTGGSSTIRMSNMETAGSDEDGRFRNVYRRVDEGPWERVAVLTDPADTLNNDTSTVPNAPAARRYRREFPQGRTRFWIRLFPRPSVDTRLEVRYLASPTMLDHDEDQVQLVPDDVQPILVHMVARDLFASFENGQSGARFHTRRVGELFTNARRRYLNVTSARTQRSSILGDDRILDPLVTPITWTP
ncbi:MAG: hypothetical protein GY788_21085 [bacterium]|nr:hypothetical protein [bacterium]